MWGVKKLAFRAILLFPLLLKPSSQAGISTCFEIVTQGDGYCNAADIQLLDGFYSDAVALVRAGINLFDNYRSGIVDTFSQTISFRNGLLYFGLLPQQNPNGQPPSLNIPEDIARWQRIRNILYRTQQFLAGVNIFNIPDKPYIYCRGWWLERVPDDSLKLVEGLPSPANPNAGQLQVPHITVLEFYNLYLVENGVRNNREVWWNKISRKYHVQSPIPGGTLGMAWDGDGNPNTRPRIALVGKVWTVYGRRLVNSRAAVTHKSELSLYNTGAATLVHEIIHLTAQGQDNDELYGFGDIIYKNRYLIDRFLDGKETPQDLGLFDRLQYTADAYAWYCLSAYLSSISEVTLDFSTGEGLNADDQIP